MLGIPLWMATGAINTSFVVPATCRLFLIMACDLTFVLARSFKEVTFRSSGQPSEKDVTAAARNYKLRGYSQHVHSDIKRLVPRRNVVASFRADTIGQAIEAIFAKYKDKLMDNVDLPLRVGRMSIGSLDSLLDDTSTEADSTLFSDLKEAREGTVELDASMPMAELDASTPLAEMSTERKVSELSATASVLRKC